MSDAFTQLIDDSNVFFAELAQNNTKDWFRAHKESYTQTIKRPADLLGDVLAEKLAALTGKAQRCKVFRIHRDVRFSKDKTPYNTHLHLSWSQPGRDGGPGWFLGSAPDYLTLGCGVMSLDKEGLERFRAAVDARGAALQSEVTKAETQMSARLSDYGPAPLKRVPKPYPSDHPLADLLKRKSFSVFAPFPKGWRQQGLVEASMLMAEKLLPIWSWQDEVLS